MKLEPIIQSKVSRKIKYQYSILTQVEFRKTVNDDLTCERAKATQMCRTVFWTLWEKARVGWFERIALKHIYYRMWNRSPVQVWCIIQDAQGWWTGMTQRDGMGREVGREFKIGNTCTPWLIHVNVWQKPPQYCKVITLQLK